MWSLSVPSTARSNTMFLLDAKRAQSIVDGGDADPVHDRERAGTGKTGVPTMKFVIAPDSYKESLSAPEVAQAVEARFRHAYSAVVAPT